jgi:hypothetical protein
MLGSANLIAGGFSRAVGNYLAIKTRHEYMVKGARKREESEIYNMID